MLTFDPDMASPAPEVTALGDSVTIIGDRELAADLDMGDSMLQLKGEWRGSAMMSGWGALESDLPPHHWQN